MPPPNAKERNGPCEGTTEVRKHIPGGWSRDELVNLLFHTLTADGSPGFVGADQLHRFARACGFHGTHAEWQAEYKAICSRYSADSGAGLEPAQFKQFLDDPEGSAHCTAGDLYDLSDLLVYTPSPSEPAGALRRCIWAASGWDSWPVCVPRRGPQSCSEQQSAASAACMGAADGAGLRHRVVAAGGA